MFKYLAVLFLASVAAAQTGPAGPPGPTGPAGPPGPTGPPGQLPSTNPVVHGVITADGLYVVPQTNGFVDLTWIGVATPLPPTNANILRIEMASDPTTTGTPTGTPTSATIHEMVSPCTGVVTSTGSVVGGVHDNTRGCGQALMVMSPLPATCPVGNVMYINYSGQVASCQNGTLTTYQLSAGATLPPGPYTDPMTGSGPVNANKWSIPAGASGLNYSANGAVPSNGVGGAVYSACCSFGAAQSITGTLVGTISPNADASGPTLLDDGTGDSIHWLFANGNVVVLRAGQSGNTTVVQGCPFLNPGNQFSFSITSAGLITCANLTETNNNPSSGTFQPSWMGAPGFAVSKASSDPAVAISNVTVQ